MKKQMAVLCAVLARGVFAAMPFVTIDVPDEGHPALDFRRTVTCTGMVARADWAITGLGVFVAKVNGRTVGTEELMPGYTMQFARQRHTFDIAGLLKDGENVLEVRTCAAYWREGLVGARGCRPIGFADELTLVDGSGRRVLGVADGGWRVSALGPLVRATIWDGETYDARREEIADWRPALVTNLEVRAEEAKGAVVVRTDKVRTASVPFAVRPGERKVVDFGQNCAGRETFRVSGPRGATVTVRHAEVLNPDGTCSFENLRWSKATTQYTLKGEGEEEYRPRFTYYGFRYVEISATAPVRFSSFACEPLTSVAQELETGTIRTSDEDVNKVISCAEWSLRSNQLSVPTDCPQRDERQAWLGDACLSVPAACWLWDARDFYAKSTRDQRDAQKSDGRFSSIAPGNPGWMSDDRYGVVAWADTGILMPYWVWRHFGDLADVRTHYASMAAYADWLARSGGPVPTGWGDWLAFHRTGFGEPAYPYASDPDTFAFLAAAYRVRDFAALAEMAEALGRREDAARYARLRDEALAAVRKTVFDAKGGMLPRFASQTTLALALEFGLCPDEAARAKAVSDLVASVENAGHRLMTGIIGTAFILYALSNNGHAALAYDLLLSHACPSWLYMTDRGATTLWEHWDGILSDGRFFSPTMNSFNHAEFASVLDWMYRTMAGIQPNRKKGGFDEFVLSPQPDPRIRTVEAEYRTPKGVIRVRSHYGEDGKWTYDYKLPSGTTAKVILPGQEPVCVRQD